MIMPLMITVQAGSAPQTSATLTVRVLAKNDSSIVASEGNDLPSHRFRATRDSMASVRQGLLEFNTQELNTVLQDRLFELLAEAAAALGVLLWQEIKSCSLRCWSRYTLALPDSDEGWVTGAVQMRQY